MPSGPPRINSSAIRPWAHIVGDRRGAVIIEFAICASAFLALLLACAQTVLIFFIQQGLQTAAEASARYVMTGEASKGGITADQFRTYACNKMPPVVDCSRLIVDLQKANNFNDIDTSMPTLTLDGAGQIGNSWQYTMGGSGDIMILRVMYVWSVSLGPLNLDFSNAGRGRRLLIGTMVFKSEPYSI